MEHTWSYRIVNLKSENGGDDWYALREVHYVDGKPVAHAAPCLGTETVEQWDWLLNKVSHSEIMPPLQETDFPQP